MNLNQFWNTCPDQLPHIMPVKGEHVTRDIIEYLGPVFDFDLFRGKDVIDYGIGGGYIAKLIIEKYQARKYYGYDISERSLAAADKLLSGNKNYELFLTFENSFPEFPKVDFFICLAVIQHFPNYDYFRNFLKAVNLSQAKNLILQIRFSPFPFFRDHDYSDMTDVSMSCVCNKENVNELLTNYELVNFSQIFPKNNYQYLIYKKNE